MKRLIVNVATGSYRKGQERLYRNITDPAHLYTDLHPDWPKHADKPYAFKAYAMKEASYAAHLLLWCDACILPVQSLEPLWECIEREGYWISRNGWTNYEWTADAAYPDLFPEFWRFDPNRLTPAIDDARVINRRIPHVVATAFGLNVKHPKGKAFLDEYYRLASETRAFCGPWINASSQWANEVQQHSNGAFAAPCGPADVRGHRH